MQSSGWGNNNFHHHSGFHQPTPGQEAFGHNMNSHAGKRKLATLSDACTDADLQRAAMGMPVECMNYGFGQATTMGAIHPGYRYPHNTHGVPSRPTPGEWEMGHNRNQHTNGRKLAAVDKHDTR